MKSSMTLEDGIGGQNIGIVKEVDYEEDDGDEPGISARMSKI